MRTRFDEQLHMLNRELITMGGLCEEAIGTSAKALLEGDRALAEKVPELAGQIQEKEREIESLCMKLLLQQQPVARDLRTISSALKMITDMERIGHQSADIAEIITMANISASHETLNINAMADAAIKMVKGSIDAFVRKDVVIAQSVVSYDDVVDGFFDEIKEALIRRLASQPGDGEYAIDLLMISKYFERIGDHAVNIAQWVLFSITGNREGNIQ